jgi:uncharacterized damage-inducible protein DinB
MSRRQALIDALAATPHDLARTLRRVAPEQARRRVTTGEWCIADVVAHLVEMELRYLGRLRRIVQEENPSIPYLHPDEAAHDVARPLDQLLQGFTERRGETLAFLAGLEQRDWGRPLVHETLGPSRLREQVQALVNHDSEHLAQIATLREQL